MSTAREEAPAPNTNPPPERRADPRQGGQGLLVRFLIRPDDPPGLGVLRDVSDGGFGFVAAKPVAPGTELHEQLHDRAGDAVVVRRAVVRHATAHPEGGWLVGCAFTCRLADNLLNRLLR